MSEIVYLGHDNSIYFVLKEDGVAEDLVSVNKMELLVGDDYKFSSLVSDGATFDWAFGVKGGVEIKLGQTALAAGTYRSKLIIYDPIYANGLVWGTFDLFVE